MVANSESQEVKRKKKGKLREGRTKSGRPRGKKEKWSLLSGREWKRLVSWSCRRGPTSPTSSRPVDCSSVCVRYWKYLRYQDHGIFCSPDFAFARSQALSFFFFPFWLHAQTLTLSRCPSGICLSRRHRTRGVCKKKNKRGPWRAQVLSGVYISNVEFQTKK